MRRKPSIKADCYSAGERSAMEWTQKLRGRVFGPLLTLLARCRITPDQLTLLSFLVGVAFCPLYYWSKPAAFTALALHMLLDGLDGPLARHTGIASRRGSFTDTLSDQTVVAASTITLMATHTIGTFAGGFYVFLYTVVVLFAMVRNALSLPYSWLVRPRSVVYAWLLVETYMLPGSIDCVLWVANGLLATRMLSGFWKIRKRL